MAAPKVVLQHTSAEALTDEYEKNLRQGRAFVQGPTSLKEGDPCELVLVHPSDGAELAVHARVVWVRRETDRPGLGLQLEQFGDELGAELRDFAHGHSRGEAQGAAAAASARRSTPRAPLHERLRRLNTNEQVKLAKHGELTERILLERLYGKNVWDALLRNPRLTPPEVARLARMGTMPVPLLEQIVHNASWLSSPQVRRALLSNRRLGRDMVTKVLRATPKAELKLVPKQTAYPLTVRQAAKKMLKT